MPEQNKPRSSVISDFDYDGSREKLYITFISGKTYVYNRVPPQTYEGLATASSKGAFFNQHIKDRYPYAAAASWPTGIRH
jgi:hypothetical protein